MISSTALTLLATAVLALSPGQREGPRPTTPLDSTNIRHFWAELDAAWGDRKADVFVGFFTEDASFALVDRGQWMEGREAIRQYFTEQFRRQNPELIHTTVLTGFHRLADGIVAVDGEVRIVDGGSADAQVLRRLAISAVMSDGPRGWGVRLLRAYILPLAGSGS